MTGKRKIIDIILSTLFLIQIMNPLIQTSFIISVEGDVVGGVGYNAWHNDSSLIVKLINFEPRINWYDFQYNNSGTWVSRLNNKIEVDNNSEYRFIINVSSDQGWDDIEFINFTAWFDNGTESSFYNQTNGGNINLYIQYENTSATSNNPEFRFNWPDNEVTFTGYSETVVNDSAYGLAGLTEARNITVSFIPNCQFRFAPGLNDSWSTREDLVGNTSKYALYNIWSWNFNITASDGGENMSGQSLSSWVTNEFGVYAYTEILSAQNPSILGFPDANISVIDPGGSGNVSIRTISNGNYSLALNISNLIHQANPIHNISNDNLYVRGGNRSIWERLNSFAYLYGGGIDGMPNYHMAENDGNFVNTSNIEYKCYIPMGQLAGEYSTQIHYYLKTEQ